MAAILKIGIRTPLGIINGLLAKSNDLKKKCLLHYWLNVLHYREVLHYWLILLHYREVLHYREFITLLEQNIIIDIFQDIPLVFMAAILKIGILTPLGILNGFLAKSNDLKKKCLLHYWLNLLHYREVLHYWLILLHYREVLHYREFITLLEQNIITDIFQDIPLVLMAAILKIGIRTPLGIFNRFLAKSNDLKKNVYHIIG